MTVTLTITSYFNCTRHTHYFNESSSRTVDFISLGMPWKFAWERGMSAIFTQIHGKHTLRELLKFRGFVWLSKGLRSFHTRTHIPWCARGSNVCQCMLHNLIAWYFGWLVTWYTCRILLVRLFTSVSIGYITRCRCLRDLHTGGWRPEAV